MPMPHNDYSGRRAAEPLTKSAGPRSYPRWLDVTQLAELALPAVHVVMAIRLAVLCRRRGQCAMALLVARLGTKEAAVIALELVELVGTLWPDRFCLSPPCCQRLSHDEQLIAQLATAATRGNTVRFHAAGHDYLADEPMAQLYKSLRLFDAMTC